MALQLINTRDTILKTARDLVQTKSYSGFGFQELAAVVGIRKASLYHHFASKEALVVALVRDSQKRIEELFEQVSFLPGSARLKSFLVEIGRGIGAGNKMCPGGALIANWDSLPPELREATSHLPDAYISGFIKIIDAGRQDGSIRDGLPSTVIAKSLFASFQGAIMLARVSGNRDDYKVIVDSLMQTFSTGTNNE